MTAIKKRTRWAASALFCAVLLNGCDHIYGLLEIPDPVAEKGLQESEGKAVGSACRYSGRSLEDCYILNPDSSKTFIFAGWREMNDYMLENNIETVASKFVPKTAPKPLAPTAANVPPALPAGNAENELPSPLKPLVEETAPQADAENNKNDAAVATTATP